MVEKGKRGRKEVSDSNWAKMFKQLSEFRKKEGHANVPANYSANINLGRWVAAQRYKAKIGDYPPERLAQLNKLDFIWQPGDDSWNKMYDELVAFKKQSGQCNVPESWGKGKSLANWVQSQRHKRKQGKLSSERVALLDKIDFSWAIYKREAETIPEPVVKKVEVVVEEEVQITGERLYMLRVGVYVQYDGKGPMPKEIDLFIKARGDFPPYIPLPKVATNFYTGESSSRENKLKWKGKGPLPEEVLNYVRRNGTLPRYDYS